MSRPRLLPRVLPVATTLLVAALLLALGAPALAGRAKPRPPAKADATVQPAPAPAGMVAAVDPLTGRLGRPTAAQRLGLGAAERTGLLHSSEGLTEVRLPDGSSISKRLLFTAPLPRSSLAALERHFGADEVSRALATVSGDAGTGSEA